MYRGPDPCLPVLTVPLFALVPEAELAAADDAAAAPADRPPRPRGPRLRPERALDLVATARQLLEDELMRRHLGPARRPWSLLAVLSPYTPLEHVMLMETSMAAPRYLPGPESGALSRAEGTALCAFLADTAAVLARLARARAPDATLHVGYNWSPRAWGAGEERMGFQSIPTKLHLHAWTWPRACTRHIADGTPGLGWARWCEPGAVRAGERSLLGAAPHLVPMAHEFARRLDAALAPDAIAAFFDGPWCVTPRGIERRLRRGLVATLAERDFFPLLLQPLAVTLDRLLRDLSAALTTMDADRLDALLAHTGVF